MSGSSDRLAIASVLLFLALRLLTWVCLLPPWAGFDEAHHQSYAESCAERLVWPSFRGISLSERLAADTRRWPAPGGAPRPVAGETNYETQQSPLYYWLAGFLLRGLDLPTPTQELYALRLANALFALAVGWLLLQSARSTGFGKRAWVALAIPAFLPGFGLALTRVSNDAFCATLLSAAVAGGLQTSSRGRIWGAAAGGIAPWAKLYGLAAVPILIWHAARIRTRDRLLRLALLAAPTVLLVFVSWRIHDNVLPMQENLHARAAASPADVPWIRDAWTIVKTHIYVSGVSGLVFPNPIYLVAAGLLVVAAARALRPDGEPASGKLPLLVPALLVAFGLALAYHAWRNFSFFRGPGGTGGWYLWAMAVPEALLLGWGLSGAGSKWWLAATLLVLLGLTTAGDLVLVADAAGRVRASAARHVVGLSLENPGALLRDYLSTRPRIIAAGGIVTAVLSWRWAGRSSLATSLAPPPDPRRQIPSADAQRAFA